MPRNTLDNALRYQKYLTNTTTCLTCAIQQSLNTKKPLDSHAYLCLDCGEVFVLKACAVICPSCASEHCQRLEDI